MSSNDNDLPSSLAPGMPDSHGRAALLLVESLIHGLCENGTVSVGEAVAITRRAAEVQHEQAEAADGSGAPMWQAHSFLSHILASLKTDDAGPPLGT